MSDSISKAQSVILEKLKKDKIQKKDIEKKDNILNKDLIESEIQVIKFICLLFF
jgi:hypothetical protein